MNQTILLSVDDISMAGEARRTALQLCAQMGFTESSAGKVALVATELATNLAKHATAGQLLIHLLRQGDWAGIELLSVDRGPGMSSVTSCMRDGYSTAGSPGTGLGAIQRNSTEFDIYSQPGRGTVVVSRIWNLPSTQVWKPPQFHYGAVCVPISGEDISGDTWSCMERPDGMTVMLADGLGHGIQAAESSRQAVRLFESNHHTPPSQGVLLLHQGLSGTRGCALAIADISLREGCVRNCGIGNICSRVVLKDTERNLVSHNGIAGYEARKIQEFSTPWELDALLVMHSDGMTARWHLSDYPLLSRCHPAVIAAVLYRDHARGHDDVSVVVIRESRAYAAHPEVPFSHDTSDH